MTLPLIDTCSLFEEIDTHLLTLLVSLTHEEWLLPSGVGHWTIKDIAAHLLDGNMRNISAGRDGFMVSPSMAIASYHDLVEYIRCLNAEWVQAYRRISPAVLIQQLQWSNNMYRGYLQTLSPSEPALYGVAWAGQDVSPNWFHIAREYTEKWHHQQQIYHALHRASPLLQAHLYRPYLQTSMMAMPHWYRRVSAPRGTAIAICITGTVTGTWTLVMKDVWELYDDERTEPVVCTVSIPDTIAWRIFSKGITEALARELCTMEGEMEYGLPILSMVAVMA